MQNTVEMFDNYRLFFNNYGITLNYLEGKYGRWLQKVGDVVTPSPNFKLITALNFDDNIMPEKIQISLLFPIFNCLRAYLGLLPIILCLRTLA